MKGKRKNKMGRPLAGWEGRTEYIRIRLTPTERTILNRDARRAGKNISGLLMAPWRDRAEGEGE